MILHYKAGDPGDHKTVGQKLQGLQPGEYVIEITRNRPIRSLSHNRYYWGIVLKQIAIACDHNQDELHEMFKLKFNSKLIEFKDGSRETVPGTTGDLDTKEFALYVERVKAWAVRFLDIRFVEPQDTDYEKWSKIREEYDGKFNSFVDQTGN